ncbi:MAG: TonB-dependent receptor plug domain-containing protein, partial [Muribaculaceae bacterium]|nr:TonB-dependent receptor plug domain-containing protein [Muribaculaceae bacterium]
MKKPIISLSALALVAVAAAAESAGSDQTVTQLRDVEIVGVKQMPVNPLEPVTRLDSSTITSTNLTSMKGVSEIAPNFYIPEYGSRMTSSIYVRGLGARIDQPVVGLNVDNVPYLNKDNYDFELVDLESIEVVRGSSGVLNGRNSLGGQINVRTLSPWKFNGFKALAEYGKANSARVGAGWFGRLSSKLATSITGYYTHTDGFFRNDETGERSGLENAGGARWKLSWHPESRWSLMNTASVTAGKQNGYPYASLDNGKIGYTDPTFYRRTNFTDGLTVSYTGNRMIATSITSVQYSDDNMTLDQDFLPEDYFTLTQARREWTWTQDIFAKGTRGSYNWLLGAFGFYKSGRMDAPVTFLNTGLERLIEDNVNSILPAGMALRWDNRSMLLGNDFDIRNGGFAIYHQSAYTLGRFVFQAGLRWDIERAMLDYRSDVDATVTMYRSLPTGAQVPLAQRELSLHDSGSLSQTFNELLPQIAVGYNGDNWKASARVAKGYKAGGYNTQMFSDVLQQQLMETVGVPVTY